MGIQVNKVPNDLKLDRFTEVKFTEMGNVLEIQYMSNRNTKASIQMLKGGNEYLHIATGEIKEVTHHCTRYDQKKSLARTFSNIRSVINANITNVYNVRWITLTYAENMQDTKRLYKDFEKFNKRFRTYCDKNSYGRAEYIVICEPQQRGAWHCHLLYIWDRKAPFIPNNELEKLWRHGFTRIEQLDNVDNVGAYLTAYLGDMPLGEYDGELEGTQIKQVVNKDGDAKYYVKGARLNLYPTKFNMMRTSRNIKRATSVLMPLEMAMKKVNDATLTYEKTIKLKDDENNFESIINTKYYNISRKKVKE